MSEPLKSNSHRWKTFMLATCRAKWNEVPTEVMTVRGRTRWWNAGSIRLDSASGFFGQQNSLSTNIGVSFLWCATGSASAEYS